MKKPITLFLILFATVAYSQETVKIKYFQDYDQDGYGNVSIFKIKKPQFKPDGYVIDSTDCNDSDNTIFHTITYYVDADGDGWGAGAQYKFCSNPPLEGYSEISGDCNDNNRSVNRDAPEICNGVDDNCNGQIDEGWYHINITTTGNKVNKELNSYCGIDITYTGENYCFDFDDGFIKRCLARNAVALQFSGGSQSHDQKVKAGDTLIKGGKDKAYNGRYWNGSCKEGFYNKATTLTWKAGLRIDPILNIEWPYSDVRWMISRGNPKRDSGWVFLGLEYNLSTYNVDGNQYVAWVSPTIRQVRADYPKERLVIDIAKPWSLVRSDVNRNKTILAANLYSLGARYARIYLWNVDGDTPPIWVDTRNPVTNQDSMRKTMAVTLPERLKMCVEGFPGYKFFVAQYGSNERYPQSYADTWQEGVWLADLQEFIWNNPIIAGASFMSLKGTGIQANNSTIKGNATLAYSPLFLNLYKATVTTDIPNCHGIASYSGSSFTLVLVNEDGKQYPCCVMVNGKPVESVNGDVWQAKSLNDKNPINTRVLDSTVLPYSITTFQIKTPVVPAGN